MSNENSNNNIIKTINDYFDWLKALTNGRDGWAKYLNVNVHTPLMNFYFRGQANSEWEIESGVLRSPYKDDASYENRILKKAELKLSRELSIYPTYLEKLTFLQHYGLRTRLLDVSLNPLVALYYACSGNDKDKDGVVFAGKRYIEDSKPIAELTAEFVFNFSAEDISTIIDSFLKGRKVDYSLLTQPLFVNPPINNPRIEHQQGAFIISPLIKIENGIMQRNTDSIESSHIFSKRKAIIPTLHKDELLYHLHILGIDEGSLFQGTPERLKTIMQEEDWRKKYIMLIDMSKL